MEVYLIRHTRLDIEPGICYGQTDIPIAESFLQEAEMVRSKLSLDLDGYRAYSSPLSRCRRLAEHLQLTPLTLDPRLMELHFGDWELKAWDDISPGSLRSWTADFVEQRCPGGESYRDQFDRGVAFWQELCQTPADQVFVVTHAGLIRTLLAYVLDTPLDKSLRLSLDYGSVTKIRFRQDVPIIDYINR
ncbi:alpha-ribazole phosphatase [candidate division KSB3 bacterium]|uniref:Alpha-ribazole phosphatase n=1 Tax=candidate division KSB3 bacterium TaxID=2044937 RepID=A0A9D5JYF2_9BACT|nr:alpha-ribazole phosphatase [candidate division KSB3 bacterium]MBD3326649.1 alpha-ribazole phosphatase [candidate division KSB3 bacterium]